jgi:23S rRNA (pseudouridine1915-N3)-methyltransferase
MQIHLIAIGQRLDNWVLEGYGEFVKRMPPECRINLIEVASNKRTKNSDTRRIIQEEGERLIAAIPTRSHVIAMDAGGKEWSTVQLADQLGQWLGGGRDIALLVGGPDGLSEECKALAESLWSLSKLTLPHPMVRVVIAEQLYRAWTILQGHPYHR